MSGTYLQSGHMAKAGTVLPVLHRAGPSAVAAGSEMRRRRKTEIMRVVSCFMLNEMTATVSWSRGWTVRLARGSRVVRFQCLRCRCKIWEKWGSV